MGNLKARSKNARIQAGYYQGLQEEIHRRTGITKPVIYKAIRDNDISSPKKFIAIQTALDIIAERNGELPLVKEPIEDYGALDIHGNYTYSDYLKWQFKERVELIRGKIFKMAPAPSTSHQTVSVNLVFEVMKLFYGKSCRVFPAPFDVRLLAGKSAQGSTVVQPDISVVCDPSKIDAKGCNGSPDLVVEILSASNQRHDLERKFELYEASGIPEYWIVHPSDRFVVVYTLVKGKYIGSRPYTSGTSISSSILPELQIPVDSVFYRLDE